jgi:hypothetical protein
MQHAWGRYIKVLVRKPVRKRYRCRWKHNIEINCKEVWCEFWAGCVQVRIGTSDRLLGTHYRPSPTSNYAISGIL